MNIAEIAVLILGLAHVGAMAAEVFDTTGLAKRIAKIDIPAIQGSFPRAADGIAALVKNQGVYNGFLAVGLLLSLTQEPEAARQTQLYLSVCVTVAGVFGAVTVNKILFVQAALGIVTFLLVFAE
ncbi:MAG: DUF1304 domain-containing protein [Pseudomonadota bacterium]